MKKFLLAVAVACWAVLGPVFPARASLDTVQDDRPQVAKPAAPVFLGPPLPEITGGAVLGPASPDIVEGDPLTQVGLGPPNPATLPQMVALQARPADAPTPRVWPMLVPNNQLAGPPTPLLELPGEFSGPPTPSPTPIPYGPPVPADGLPVAFGFVWPVGGEDSFQSPDDEGRPGFRVVRDFMPYARGSHKHMGVDLSNRQSGSTVRAIADGIVALVSDRSQGDPMHTGWGNMLVLAHRLPGGEVVYSLLAHLKDRSILVRPGDRVTAGQPIAEVGATGHADGPHLHMELRQFIGWNLLDALPQGWQHMGFLNPLNFLANHLAAFPDLPRNHWAYGFVMPLVRMGVVDPGPEFAPDQLITVSDFATMLARAFGPNVTTLGANSPEQPLQLAQALGSLQLAITAPGSSGADLTRNNVALRHVLENAIGHSISDPGHRLTRAEAAVLLRAALGANNRDPAPSTLGR